MRRLQLDWKRVPWTLWVYAAAALLSAVLSAVTVHGPILPMALLVAFALVWNYFLLKGIRWLWILTLGLSVLGLVFEVVAGSFHWRGFAMNALGLALLSLPVTRRYFAADRKAVTALAPD